MNLMIIGFMELSVEDGLKKAVLMNFSISIYLTTISMIIYLRHRGRMSYISTKRPMAPLVETILQIMEKAIL